MTEPPLPTALLEWAAQKTGGAVDRWTVEATPGGAVSPLVEQMNLYAGTRVVAVARKRALPHEVAGLQAAQAVRLTAPAIPELVTWGRDASGPWLITAWFAGEPLAGWHASVPHSLFRSLARLHAHYHDKTGGLDAIIPRVNVSWWRELCLSSVSPRIARTVDRHSAAPVARATALVAAAADHGGALATLARLTPTLLHGDVHPGNVIVDGENAGLIDWGSARIGSAMLDLANLVRRDTAEYATYAQTWLDLTGRSVDEEQSERGYQWAALQIPVQYLPWTMNHRPTDDVEAALEGIEQALGVLDAG